MQHLIWKSSSGSWSEIQPNLALAVFDTSGSGASLVFPDQDEFPHYPDQ